MQSVNFFYTKCPLKVTQISCIVRVYISTFVINYGDSDFAIIINQKTDKEVISSKHKKTDICKDILAGGLIKKRTKAQFI
jgi:hypothetical protein